MLQGIKATKSDWVLIVDDEKELAELLVEPLQQSGYKTMIAGNVAEAVSKVNRQKFACILLDIRLERGNGEQVLAEIRKEITFKNSETPVVVMSGFLSPELVGRIRDRVQSFVAKPFRAVDLVRLVNGLVSTKDHPAPSPAKKAA